MTEVSTTTTTTNNNKTKSKSKRPILKGEKASKLDASVEKEGVEKILSSLTEEEQDAMPDDHMPIRHLRAENGNVDDAIRKIKETLQWRKEFEVDKIIKCFDNKCNDDDDDNNNEDEENDSDGSSDYSDKNDEFQEILLKENETGKIYVRGYDKEGRVAMYMRPGNENTNDALNNMRHLVYSLERASACTAKKSGLEKINLMIDYKDFKVMNSPPMSTTKWTIDILQNHYPERLHKAYILNPGFFFKTFLSVIRPFLDPVTRDKIVICGNSTSSSTTKKVSEYFDLNIVENCAGGTGNLDTIKPFNSKKYLTEIPFDTHYE